MYQVLKYCDLPLFPFRCREALGMDQSHLL
jgi:hypothetical protein